MIELETSKTKQRTPLRPLSASRVTLIRIAYDTVAFLVALAGLLIAGNLGVPIFGIDSQILYIVVNALILCGSIAAYLIIRRGNNRLGINILIYSLIIGTFINSIYTESLGAFGLISTVVFTALAISQSGSFRLGVIPMATAIVLGAGGLALDTFFPGANFRTVPAFGLTTIWIPTLIFSLLILIIIGRQFPTFTLQVKMISAFVVITALSLVLMVLFNMLSLTSILTDDADQALISAATQTSGSLGDLISTYMNTIDTLAKVPAVRDAVLNPEEAQTASISGVLNLLSTNYRYFRNYNIVNDEGIILISNYSDLVGTRDALTLDYLNGPSRGLSMVSDVYLEVRRDLPLLDIYSPITSLDGTVIGVLTVRFNAMMLQFHIAENNDLIGNDSYAVLFDPYYIQLANGTNPDMIFSSITPLGEDTIRELQAQNRYPGQASDAEVLNLMDLQMNLAEAQSSGTESASFNTRDITFPDQINRAAVVPVQGTNWLVAFFQPRSNFLRPISQLGDLSVFLLIISGVFATGIGLYLTQIIVRPISNLNETATRIAEGDFTARVDVSTQDEIGKLGSTFNLMAIQLQNLFGNLEAQVTERTRELNNQTAQLKAVSEIARDVTAEETLKILLDRTAFLLYDRFGYSHVGIYLVSQNGQYAVLSASGDPHGEQLLENEHRYLIDASSNVGLACAIGRPRKVTAMDPNSGLQDHPLLPNTQAQLTLPLRTGGKSIGAIDIHSSNPRSFTEEEVDIFNTFADQIAIAIQKIQFRDEIQNTLNELESAYGQFTQESWKRFIQGRGKDASGYRFHQLNIEPITSQPEDIREVWENGGAVSQRNNPDGSTSMLIPIKVRGEVISVLDIKFESQFVPPDTQNLLTDISERLSLIMENARLIETAQKQVEQEQLASYLTGRIRQSLDLETVLRTATQEIGVTLDLAEVELRLGSVEPGLNVSGNGNPSQSSQGQTQASDNGSALNEEADDEPTN